MKQQTFIKYNYFICEIFSTLHGSAIRGFPRQADQHYEGNALHTILLKGLMLGANIKNHRHIVFQRHIVRENFLLVPSPQFVSVEEI
jgi:hypothetical protein